MVNSEIWMGSGGSVTFCPETDLFTGYMPASIDATEESGYTGLHAIGLNGTDTAGSGTAFNATYLMVNDIYTGCIADFYNSSNTLIGSHVIARNSETKLYFGVDYSGLTGLATNGYIIIRSYGAPVPAPIISGDPALLSDSWLGLVNSATFPNVEVEMKQMNLALGGGRNFTHQYKGIETASGGSVDVNLNHAAWLYYALGKCTAIDVNGSGADDTDDGVTNKFTHGASDKFLIHSESISSQGPIMYRSVGTTICPPILPSDTNAEIDQISFPSESSGAISNEITYTLGEANGNDLPSFALEYTLAKSDASPGLQIEDTTGDEVFTRIATGNMVNSLTLTSNENEELKMTLDLNTKQVVEPQTGYYSRRNVSDERDFINFGSLQGGSSNSVSGFLTPFFFYDGSISLLGQDYIKITALSLTINNNLQDKRYVGQYNRQVKVAVPAQRTYELTMSGYVTDKALWDALRNEVEDNGDVGGAGNSIINLTFTKPNGEEIVIKFDDYFVSANTWPVVDDKGPLQIDWTIMPRTLNTCTVKTHWGLQG